MISLPFSSRSAIAQPTSFLSFSAVLVPMRSEYFLLMNCITASLNLSPAYLMELLDTTPPSVMIAMSVVPPPISTIIQPVVPSTSIPAPIAAAIGSSSIYTSLGPRFVTTSSTALFSTSVTPLGTPIATLALILPLCPIICLKKVASISAAISKSDITPSSRGFTTLICAGALPSISFAD